MKQVEIKQITSTNSSSSRLSQDNNKYTHPDKKHDAKLENQ